MLEAIAHADAECRARDRLIESDVAAAIDRRDIPALMTRVHLPVAVRLLSAKTYPNAWRDLLTAGFALPTRILRGLGIHADSRATFTKAQTVRRLRDTTGRTREVVFALLTGEGDAAATLLRRLAENFRGAPLPVFDLSEAATVETTEFEERSAATKRAAITRLRRSQPKTKPKPKPKRKPVMRLTPHAKRRANVAARAAERLAKLAAECSEGESRLTFRERLALEGGQQ